ncbi:MAG: hypothetical protein NTV34_12000, partial [Proteobacteria bacterium]|nr:hypothetical protein [Pseudomonadota bacterium]
RAIYERITATFPNKVWLSIAGLALLGTAFSTLIILRLLPGSIPVADMIISLLTEWRSWQGLLNSFQSFTEIIYLHTPDVDRHAWITLLLIGIQPFTGGTYGPLNRAAAVCFAAICMTQIGISVASESYFIYTTTQAHPSIFPSARSMEPIFIAWGTGSAWRIIDALTGYRLSSSGWSIRGRDRIKK